MNGSPLDIEASVANSEPSQPFYRDISIPLTSLIWRDGGTYKPLTAVAVGTVGFAALECGASDMAGLQWEATADETDCLILPFTLPGDYSSIGRGDELQVQAWLRKRDTTGSATDNADLALQVALNPFRIGDTTATASTPTTLPAGILPAKTAVTTRASFTKYTWTWSAKLLAPYTALMFTIFPNEAVGTALTIDMLGLLVRYKAHLTIPRSER